MRQRVVVSVFVVLLSISVALAGPLGPYEPSTGCYVGAYIELDDNVAADIGSFEQLIGKKHATYFRYVGYGQPFPYKWVQDLHGKGAVPHIAWEPNEGLDPVKDDDYLHGWAQAAARSGGPIFLRYASEMNGNWMAYSGDADRYIAKWRLVYKIMHEEAPNVIMVWAPYATPRATIPMYYPGDEYVDWVGVNLYSVLHADGDPAKPPSDDPRELLKYVYDLFAYRKPIAVCEYAATHYCTATKTECVDFAVDNMTKFYQSLQTQFPRVRMINWFSVDTGKNALADNNYSVTDNARVLETYQKLTAGDYFLSRVPDEIMVAARPTTPEPVPAGPADPVRPAAPGRENPLTPAVTNLPLAATRAGIATANGAAIVIQGGTPGALKGRVEVLADIGRQLEADNVTFYVDGAFIAFTNVAPFRFTWDASKVQAGEHTLKVVVNNQSERTVATSEAAVVTVPDD
ncbi:MAG: Ig-like domain-containing protein [Bacteroidota bacterium]